PRSLARSSATTAIYTVFRHDALPISAMGTIVATPTAGSCGILPGCVFAAAEILGSDREQMVRALFVGGAIGYVIANNAFISGAADRKSTRLNSSHVKISYAVFCLKKK